MTSQTEGCHINFTDVKYTVKIPDPKTSTLTKKVMIDKQIIKGVTGKIEPGQTMAIIGASGAGKTTLLNILAGRITGEGLTGSVKYDGKSLSPNEIASIVGFVMQSDIFIEFLTVQETLDFAANLKLKGDEKSKKEKIDYLVGELKLENARNTLVGGQFRKGISGGEKKRLNIAFELISDPPVIFLDEPTSGLDSYTSYLVISLMGQIARNVKKTIIYTIHQPSSEIFRMFDRLILVYQGKIVYQGLASESIAYFKDKLTLPCPLNSNPTDHFMYILQVTHPEVSNKLIGTYQKEIEPKIDQEIKAISYDSNKPIQLKQFSPLGTQLSCLFGRQVKIAKRNPLLTIAKLVQNIFTGFVFCSIFFQISDNKSDAKAVFNKNGGLFFLTVFHYIPSMMAVIVSFPLQRDVFLKEYSGRFYSTIPYFLAKFFIEVPLSVLFPALFTCAIYYITGFYSPFVNLLKQILVAVIMTFTSNCMGMAIGCGFDSIDVALNVTPLIFFPLMLFSGFYVNSDSIPKFMNWLEYISPFRYAYEAFIYNEYEGRGYNPDPIDTFGFTFGYWKSTLLLLAIGCVYFLIAYLILFRRARIINA